jgi:4'-phosphopantetheinyl transferase N-terminal domain/Aldo/keto reductase family
MLELILPAGVESEERFGAVPDGVLFPAEEKIIAQAVQSRRRDFAAVRSCARACLERLGYPRVPILPGVGGAPTWPAGVQGSMTHCTGYAAAAVGRHPRISAIGIDAEPDAPLPDGVLDVVATPWAFGGDWGAADLAESRNAIHHALDVGINLFDTAQGYGFGAAEQVLGEALRERTRREEVIIATKGGLRLDGEAAPRRQPAVAPRGRGVQPAQPRNRVRRHLSGPLARSTHPARGDGRSAGGTGRGGKDSPRWCVQLCR